MLITIDNRLNAKTLGLNANEASVLAVITKCTQSGKGWYADIDALADALEFSVSSKTVGRAVKKLIDMGLVEKRQNVLYAQTNCPKSGTNCPKSETNCPKIGTNCPSPTPPIYKENIKEMEKENNYARAQRRTAQAPTPDSFDELLKAFTLRVGDIKLADSLRDECLRTWRSEQYPDWKKKMLIQKVQSGEWMKPRLDWLLADFDPKPENWNGRELDRNTRYVTAKFNGKWGTYTQQDVELFNLEVKS